MTVGTYVAPNNTTQDPTTYKGSIDAGMGVLANVAQQFAPHAAASPNMTVVVDAGSMLTDASIYGIVLTAKTQQTTANITAPVTYPRIDRVVIDAMTGNVSVITGAEANSPVAPALTMGKLPIAKVALATSTTQITNSLLTDERCNKNTSPGRNINTVASTTVAVQTGNTAIPYDNTSPLISEGDQFLIAATTPLSVNSTLDIHGHVHAAHANTGVIIATLFRDSTLLATFVVDNPVANKPVQIPFKHYSASANLATTTFTVRVGGGQAGMLTLNGAAGAGLFNSSMFSVLYVEERTAE